MKNDFVLYLLVAAFVTYLVRALPMTLIRKNIKNRYIRSFLYYVPYVTLSVMTFPAILTATAFLWSAVAGFLVAVLVAYFDGNLFRVALSGCTAVFLVELIAEML